MKGVNCIPKVLTAVLTALAISFFAFLPGSPVFALVQGVEDTMTIVKADLASLEKPSECYVIYDAGSSGTRLYIYEGIDLIEHKGPKLDVALADPVREIRGRRWQDADDVTTEVVSALDDMRKDGPLDESGQPKWKAFDWKTQCDIFSASVYATAGMRLAEQENRQESEKLWEMLKQKLQAKVGTSVKVNTRTLSGYEEGLYAWLAVREDEDIKNNDFGIVEMGGASSQITFPCPECDATDDAVKTVLVEKNPTKEIYKKIYSYSFLGLGLHEAWKNVLESHQSCEYGIGETQEGWKPEDCANQIALKNAQGIVDPKNYDGDGLGTYRRPYLHPQDIQWYLTGKPFTSMKKNDINQCCVDKCEECYDKEHSCFKAVYMKKYLQELNVPPSYKKMNVSWTKGAVICSIYNCLQKTVVPVCRWSQQGCL